MIGITKLPSHMVRGLLFIFFLLIVTGFAYSAMMGDVNSSVSVDIVDALLVAQYYVGLNLPQFDAAYADVDSNGKIDIADALLIAQYCVNPLTQFPTPVATPAGTDTATPVATPATASGKDAFGIINLYPDISPKQEWSSVHWNNGIQRTLSGSAGQRDSYDPTGWSQYRGNGTLNFNGSGLLVMGGGQPRIYINPYPGSSSTNPEVFWKNVEVSVYYMRIGSDGANWGGCVIGARSGPNGHGSDEGDNCTATTYYSRLRHDGAIDFEKELHHSESSVGISKKGIWGSGAVLPSNKWIGMKFVIYNINGNQNVKLEMFLDTEGGGVNGGTWTKMLEYTDDGNWTTAAPGCSYPENFIVTTGGGVVFIRNTDAAEARYKWFTVREITSGH